MFSINLARLLVLNTLFICFGLGAVLLIDRHALQSLEIGSPAYGEIVDGKDLIADILPPPLFVTEAYMLALETAQFPERRAENAGKLADLRQQFNDRLVYWRDRNLTAEERDHLQQGVEKTGAAFWALIDKMKLADTVSASAPTDADIQALNAAFYTHRSAVLELVDAANGQLAQMETAAADTSRFWNLTSMLAGILCMSVAIGVGVMLYLRAIRPVVSITGLMQRMAKGDFSQGAPGAARTDEIGSMARALDVFRQSGLENRRLHEEAETMRRRGEEERLAAQRQAEADAERRLREATAGLASGLHRLAGGDLSVRLDTTFSPEFEPLRHDFNESVSHLHDALHEIIHAVERVDQEANGIARAADEIGRRTEVQAASLEQTAAALDQIAVNVNNSAKRTEEVRGVAVQASRNADESASVVTEAERAMSRIEQSSQSISNIIGVIDEIAFQTNLLALNAGVEAARAGEAGKGFAVVAQEVRELAQRAGSAAKEIRGLIATSTTEVSGGVDLVRKTGVALKDIVTYIGQISPNMEAIAVSSREQSSGLGEVNSAVNQMDQATQQNAGMAERQNASARTLAEEASHLSTMMRRFKLADMPLAGRRAA